MNIEVFKAGKASVAVIGQGYVGLPLALLFAEAGLSTCGFDVDTAKVDQLNAGASFIDYIAGSRIKAVREKGSYRASADLSELGSYDAVIICVPTPLDHHLQPDISYIVHTGEAIRDTLRKGQLVVLESTTYPRCTREDLLPLLEASGLHHGEDFLVAFSPEREDPSNKNFSTRTIPKLVGGLTDEATQAAAALYGRIIDAVIPVSSAEVAEASKLLENIFRAVNIALVNELKVVYQKMGIDVWEVIAAASSKPFGFMPFYPGPGLGGHCIPIDPFYLTWKAKEYDCQSRFIELAGYVNSSMPHYVVDRCMDALNVHRKTLNGSKVLIVGAAYKPNVGDVRESPSLEIIDLLAEKGAEVDYYDSYAPVLGRLRKHPHQGGMRSIEWKEALVRQYDLVVLATAHDALNHDELNAWATLIVDTRNSMAKHGYSGDHIVKA